MGGVPGGELLAGAAVRRTMGGMWGIVETLGGDRTIGGKRGCVTSPIGRLSIGGTRSILATPATELSNS